MEQKYKIADFAKFMGVTPKTIYKTIDNAKINPDNHQIRTGEDIFNNRKIAVVLCTDIEFEEHKKYFLSVTGKNPVNNPECNKILTGEIINEPVKSNEDIEYERELTRELITAQKQVIEYSKEAGQVKLLTDSENRTRSEYYQLKASNTRLSIILTSMVNWLVIAVILTGISLYFNYVNLHALKEKEASIQKLNAYKEKLYTENKQLKEKK